MSDFKIGDFVEVDLGMALCAKGEIVAENARQGYRNNGLYQSLDVMRESYDTNTYKIKFLDGTTHTAYPEEIRLLSEKEQFILKLKGGQDKEMSKVYAAMDKIIENGN